MYMYQWRVAVRAVCEMNYNTLLSGIAEDTIDGTVVDGVTVEIAFKQLLIIIKK